MNSYGDHKQKGLSTEKNNGPPFGNTPNERGRRDDGDGGISYRNSHRHRQKEFRTMRIGTNWGDINTLIKMCGNKNTHSKAQ
jgi:hypothetical protein